MKKHILLFVVILMTSTGLWAETQMVSYLYPVYNTADDPTSGIALWNSTTVNAIIINDDFTDLIPGWYVVAGKNVQTGTLVCHGEVHLILADGAKLTVMGSNFTPGIQVSGDNNSLTIYGQSAQTGQLEASGSATAAGIGGGYEQDGSNITINGGRIVSSGGLCAAGIGGGNKGNGSDIIINGGVVDVISGNEGAAAIGGGDKGNGSNITINGGRVIATTLFVDGVENARYGAGIGGGLDGVGSNITITNGFVTAVGNGDASGIGNATATNEAKNIFVATRCIVKAGDSENPIDVIENDGGTDLTKKLNGKHYVTVIYDLIDAYNNGFAAGEASGDAAGYQRAKNELPTDDEDAKGTAVVITKGKKSVMLVNPEKVEYIKHE